MPTRCCVALCPKKRYLNEDGTKRSYSIFPSCDLQMKKKCLHLQLSILRYALYISGIVISLKRYQENLRREMELFLLFFLGFGSLSQKKEAGYKKLGNSLSSLPYDSL